MYTSAVNGRNSNRLLKNTVPELGVSPRPDAAGRGECRWLAVSQQFRRLQTGPTTRTGFCQQRGQTLIMFVLFMFMLILFVGLGIDLGFAYITRARLSKAVDSACLMGIRNIGQGQPAAQAIAESTFRANYGTSARDVGTVTPIVNVGSLNNNITIDVSATTAINTFFIRVLPQWQTLTVGSAAEATRPNLILSLVLDRSGSMHDNGGETNLPPAVSNFIDLFDDQLDRVSMSSFSYAERTDVTMRQPFKTDIKNAANALVFNGWTCSERGLTNGLQQNLTANAQSGEKVSRVIVFFSDGMANTWYHAFDCGLRNISPDARLWDPNTGAAADSGCTVPPTIPSINNGTPVNTSQCVAMNTEAQARAERIAWLARQGSLSGGKQITVYAIGMGDPNAPGECGGVFRALNPDFLKDLANTTDSLTYPQNQDQPVGDYAIAANSGELDEVFQRIGKEIIARLTK